MLNLLLEVLSQLQGMWRFRWYALVLVWALCAVGWTFTLSLPDQYKASARVLVNTESALEDLLRGLAVENNVMSQVDVMTRTLLSRENLSKVAQRNDLHLNAQTPAEMETLIARLKSSVSLEAGRERNLFTISYVGDEREVAKRVVSALMDSFVEDARGAGRQGSSTAQKFLDEQIASHEQRLAMAEKRLAEFKKENLGLMPGSGGDYYGRLELAAEEFRQSRSAVEVLQRKKAELEKQMAGEVPSFGLGQAPVTERGVPSARDTVIENYEERLADLLLQYTDKHPDVIALRETIEQLKTQRAAEVPVEDGVPQTAFSVDTNPVYQNLKIALSQVSIELVEAQSLLAERRKRVAELRRMVDSIPEVEAQLQQLNRDYQITKRRYEALLERREVAKLSREAKQSGEDVRFRIVDPPWADADPVFPQREVFLAVTLVFALGAGFALTFLLNMIRPIFNNRRQLEETCGLPVFGSVERIWTSTERRRLKMKTASFFAALSMLLISFALIVLYKQPASAIAQELVAGI